MQERVQVSGHIPAPPAAVWALVGDFASAWHPMIETMRSETGGLDRTFTLLGDNTAYRERLTYLSESDHVLSYQALEGIAGADRYIGQITLAKDASGTRIDWSAEITAEPARAAEIARGTRPIFEAGIAALVERAPGMPLPSSPDPLPLPHVPLQTVTLPSLPRLCLDVSQQGPRPLVLFLHGIGGARGNWAAQLQAVAPHARVAALDLRGYGGSDLGTDQSTVADHIADILRTADALGASRMVLVGLSYGAWLATCFAQAHPERLSGLVLAGGCTGMSEASLIERTAFLAARMAPLNVGKTPADFAPDVVALLAGPHATAAMKAQMLASMAAVPVATYRDALTCFTHPPGRHDFARLTMPVLLMTGQHDRLAPPAEIRAVARRIVDAGIRPDVRFEEIAGAGHLCNIESGQEFSRHLINFVQRVAE